MRNILRVEAVYWNFTGVHGLHVSYGWWRMSSRADLVARGCYERANVL
jgi:heme/copper-type cytochrome/quinol oxidase subunit 3